MKTQWRRHNEVGEDGTLHVWPDTETGEHVLHGKDCECIPKVRKYRYGTVVTHHSLKIICQRRKRNRK